ncbi:hypothetical protein G3I55_40025, partial [Streptomyces sp. SID6648]|nr:hypothetical protein [Streptomyces sp. SID6648]
MADSTSEKLYAQLMAGTNPSRFAEREPKGSATAHEIQRRMLGDADYSDRHED